MAALPPALAQVPLQKAPALRELSDSELLALAQGVRAVTVDRAGMPYRIESPRGLVGLRAGTPWRDEVREKPLPLVPLARVRTTHPPGYTPEMLLATMAEALAHVPHDLRGVVRGVSVHPDPVRDRSSAGIMVLWGDEPPAAQGRWQERDALPQQLFMP